MYKRQGVHDAELVGLDGASRFRDVHDGVHQFRHLHFRSCLLYTSRKHAGAGTGAGAGAACQGMKFRLINLACLKAGDSLKHAVPVSYTHLDVYKRQG